MKRSQNKTEIILKKIILSIFLLNTFISECQTIHAIIVGATMDEERILKEGLNVNMTDIGEELKLVAENTNLSVKLYDFTNYQFQSNLVRNAINNLICNSQDVIFFYYAGHGFRYNNQNDPWPVLAVDYNINTISDASEHGIPLSEIVNNLKNKNARLTIVVAECCNKTNGYKAPTIEEFKGQANLSFSIRDPQRLKELYEQSSGFIVASSSIPGQVSKVNSRLGSYFTRSFVEVHKELTGISNNANWEDIFKKAKERTIRIAEVNGFNQEPQYEINVYTPATQNFTKWNGIISNNQGAYNNVPANFQHNDLYRQYQFPIARIAFYYNSRVFFLMSDNYIVEYDPSRGGLILTGYRSMPMQPQRYQWDIVNPVSPFENVVYGVDYWGKVWIWDNYGGGWMNVGVVYY